MNVNCPGPSDCTVVFQGFGRGLPTVDVAILTNGSYSAFCSGGSSCQTVKKTWNNLPPGSVLTLGVIASGTPLALLTEARLVVKRTS